MITFYTKMLICRQTFVCSPVFRPPGRTWWSRCRGTSRYTCCRSGPQPGQTGSPRLGRPRTAEKFQSRHFRIQHPLVVDIDHHSIFPDQLYFYCFLSPHNLIPAHKSENRRLLRLGETEQPRGWLIFAIKHIHTHYIFMRLVMQKFPTNQLYYIWIFKAKCKPRVNAYSDIMKIKCEAKLVLYPKTTSINS